MSDQEIKAESRLMAIEYMICHTYNMVLRMVGADEDVITSQERVGVQGMDQQTIGIPDPAMSDHVLGEFQDALSRLHAEAREMRALLRKQQGS